MSELRKTLEQDMAEGVRNLLGDGYEESFYRQYAEDFINSALDYEQAARAQSDGGEDWLIQMRGDYLVTRGVWERPDHRGYTNDINEAGRFTESDAKEAERMLPDKCKAVRMPASHLPKPQEH